MSNRAKLSIPGIYTITHAASGKTYIGQTINFRLRWMTHRYALNRNVHRNRYLQNAWNKHGPEAFVFAIFKDMSDIPSDDLLDALNKAEIDAFSSFPDVYNLMQPGGVTLRPSQETIDILSKRRLEMWSDPAFRADRSEKTKALYQNAEWKEVRDEASRVGKRTPEHRAFVSKQSLALWQNPEHKAEQGRRRKANWQDREYRAQQTASRAATWLDPVKRQNRIDGLKAAWARRKAASE